MKGIKFIVRLAIAATAALAFVLGTMLYLSRSGEHHAKEVCSKVEEGKVFDEREFYGKRPILLNQDNARFYSYVFLMNFDVSAQCKVFVDGDNIVIRTEVDVR